MIRKFSLYLLFIYQKFFTLIGYGSCRYYPTCSEYAKWQFEKNNLIKAPIFTIIRILKCNQLFKGGTDYPIIKLNLDKNFIITNNINIHKNIKYWFVPVIKDGNILKSKYYMLKHFKNM